MGGHGTHGGGSLFFHQISCLGNGSGSVYHVVYQNDVCSLYFADDLNVGHFIGLASCFVAQHQWAFKVFGIGACTFRTAYIRSRNYDILEV